MEFKIEKGVPVSPNGAGRPQGSIYPFADMEIGDSFVAPKKVASSAAAWGKRRGAKFTSRKEGDGVRIWRIA